MLTTIAFALALLRVAGVKHVAFQAAAHLFVGLLAGRYYEKRDPLHLTLIVSLSTVELICFLFDRL